MPGKFILITVGFALYITFSISDGQAQMVKCYENKNGPANATYETLLKNFYFLDYSIYIPDELNVIKKAKSDSTEESYISKKHEAVFANKGTILLSRKMSFEQDLTVVSIIKYYLVNANGNKEARIIQLRQNKNSWIELGKSKNKEIYYVLERLDAGAFWEFCGSQYNDRFPEISKAKANLKGQNGTINIFKLYTLLINNSSTFQKYLD